MEPFDLMAREPDCMYKTTVRAKDSFSATSCAILLGILAQVGTRLARASQPPGARNPSKPHFQQYRETFENNEFILIYPPTPLAAGRARQRSKDSKGQEGLTGSKGQEARSKAKALFSSFGSRAFRSLAAGKRKRRLVSCRRRK